MDFVPVQEWTVDIVFDTDEDEANRPTAKWPDGMLKQLSCLTIVEWKLIREQGKKSTNTLWRGTHKERKSELMCKLAPQKGRHDLLILLEISSEGVKQRVQVRADAFGEEQSYKRALGLVIALAIRYADWGV